VKEYKQGGNISESQTYRSCQFSASALKSTKRAVNVAILPEYGRLNSRHHEESVFWLCLLQVRAFRRKRDQKRTDPHSQVQVLDIKLSIYQLSREWQSIRYRGLLRLHEAGRRDREHKKEGDDRDKHG
jgi:hypothetical protein